jgi:hypothetical protein
MKMLDCPFLAGGKEKSPQLVIDAFESLVGGSNESGTLLFNKIRKVEL